MCIMIVFIVLMSSKMLRARGVLDNYDNVELLIPAMGANVNLVLSMTATTTLGMLLSALF